MVEPTTAIGAGLAVLGSKDVLTKLLGPTADYLGGEIAGFVEKCNINLDAVFVKAARKLGDRIDKPGSVSPRVLRHILDDGRFCEDEVAAEYYGGLLAGSREVTGKDDQSLPYLSKIKEMSVYQIRLHFAFYYEVLRHHQGSSINLGVGNECHQAGLLLPHSFILGLLPPEKCQKYWDLMTHSVVGLSNQGLITTYAYGDEKTLNRKFRGANSAGAYMVPSFLGAELFLWALGTESPNAHRFFECQISDVEQILPIPTGSQAKNVENQS